MRDGRNAAGETVLQSVDASGSFGSEKHAVRAFNMIGSVLPPDEGTKWLYNSAGTSKSVAHKAADGKGGVGRQSPSQKGKGKSESKFLVDAGAASATEKPDDSQPAAAQPAAPEKKELSVEQQQMAGIQAVAATAPWKHGRVFQNGQDCVEKVFSLKSKKSLNTGENCDFFQWDHVAKKMSAEGAAELSKLHPEHGNKKLFKLCSMNFARDLDSEDQVADFLKNALSGKGGTLKEVHALHLSNCGTAHPAMTFSTWLSMVCADLENGGANLPADGTILNTLPRGGTFLFVLVSLLVLSRVAPLVRIHGRRFRATFKSSLPYRVCWHMSWRSCCVVCIGFR